MKTPSVVEPDLVLAVTWCCASGATPVEAGGATPANPHERNWDERAGLTSGDVAAAPDDEDPVPGNDASVVVDRSAPGDDAPASGDDAPVVVDGPAPGDDAPVPGGDAPATSSEDASDASEDAGVR